MNRTAKCIRMLCILSEEGKVGSKELADRLDTNYRNIREYRKELEEAGFLIKAISGMNGRYELIGNKIRIQSIK